MYERGDDPVIVLDVHKATSFREVGVPPTSFTSHKDSLSDSDVLSILRRSLCSVRFEHPETTLNSAGKSSSGRLLEQRRRRDV